MKPFSSFQMTVILAALIVASVNLVHGQISSPCTTSMISSFTPCANIITGSTNNGLLPPTTCCDSLRSLMSTNMDCACLVISANAPFLQQPIKQALAVSLSQACNINGVPVCKASGSSLPAPGSAVLGSNSPSPSSAASLLSPQVSKTVAVAEAHKYESMKLARALAPAPAPAPALPPMEAETPTKAPGIRPVLTPRPSSSHPSCVSLSPSAFILIAIMVFGIH